MLKNSTAISSLEGFFRPLFNRDPEKIYNLNKALQYQKPSVREEEEDTEELLDFDEEVYQKEQEQKRREKLKQYETSLGTLLDLVTAKGEIALKDIPEEIQDQLIPSVEIFKEIMVELIRNKEIDLDALKKERSEFIQEETADFQLNEMLLQLSENRFRDSRIHRLEIYRIEDGTTVTFNDVQNEKGERKCIHCSNILIRMTRNEE